MLASIVVVRATDGFTIERQNEPCTETFGPVVGKRWMTLETAPGEVIAATYFTIQETLDTGQVTRLDTDTVVGPGVLTATRLRCGGALVSWKPTPLVIPEATSFVVDRRVRVARKTWTLLHRAGVLLAPHAPSLLPTRDLPEPAGRGAARGW